MTDEGTITVVQDGSINKAEPDFDNVNIQVEHGDIRQKALELKDKANESYWELGIVLNEIYTNDYYRSWGFTSWKDYVDEELDFGMRKAQYLVKMQKWFDQMPPAMQTWLRSLGWVKCRMLQPMVTTENAKQWKSRVKGKSLREIEGIINKVKKGEPESDDSGESSSSESTKNAESLVRRSFSLYAGQDEVVRNAISRAKEIGETDKDGHALSLICTEYLANAVDLIDIVSLFKHIEDITGHRIIAMKPVDGQDDDIVFGQEYIQMMAEKAESDENSSEN